MEDNVSIPNSAPNNGPEVKSDMPTAPSGSLIQQPHHDASQRPYLLWLIVLITLGATGFVGYMAYQQQQALSTYQQSMDAYQVSMRQWTDQVGALQSTVQDLRIQTTQTPTMLSTPSPSAAMTLSPSAFSWSGGLSGSPLATSAPTQSPSVGGTDSKLDMSATDRGIMFDEDDTSNADAGSLSGGKMTAEDEKNMLDSYLNEIKQGQHKTTQPSGLAIFKSRQINADGSLNYDIFKSTIDEDTFFIYVRGTAAGPSGWYGPFSSFPSS